MILQKPKSTQRKGKPLYEALSQLLGDDEEQLTKLKDTVTDEGFLLDKDLKGEIIKVSLAPNETKIISHGLRSIPQYRIILRQIGNAVIDDWDDSKWTDKTFALRNHSANSVTLTIKLFPG